VLERLGALSGVTLARMSGSGATCFALFESIAARDDGVARIKQELPDAWCLASVLR
jgi:4-diphosphocytidyl-2-C-methyl-D-erythritol kinase